LMLGHSPLDEQSYRRASHIKVVGPSNCDSHVTVPEEGDTARHSALAQRARTIVSRLSQPELLGSGNNEMVIACVNHHLDPPVDSTVSDEPHRHGFDRQAKAIFKHAERLRDTGLTRGVVAAFGSFAAGVLYAAHTSTHASADDPANFAERAYCAFAEKTCRLPPDLCVLTPFDVRGVRLLVVTQVAHLSQAGACAGILACLNAGVAAADMPPLVAFGYGGRVELNYEQAKRALRFEIGGDGGEEEEEEDDDDDDNE